MLDSLRRDHIGCYGNDWIKTENIAAENKGLCKELKAFNKNK